MKKILVTGTTGFLGSRILPKLLEKYDVVDLIRKDSHDLKKLRSVFKNYNSIILDKNKFYLKKLKNKKFYCFIHFATLYKREFYLSDIKSLINSNINFPYNIILTIGKNVKKIINFGSYMEYQNGQRDPKNVYGASKIFFEEILNLLKNNIKIYNIKLFETFDEKDTRHKIMPQLIKSYKNNKKFFLFNNKIELNFTSIDDIYNLIEFFLKKNIKSSTYFIKNRKSIKILNLIKKINIRIKKKIKFKIGKLNNKKVSNKKFYIWNSNFKIQNEIIKIFKNINK